MCYTTDMTQLTFVTPVSPSHVNLLQRAVNSVQAQTVRCEHVIVYDHDRLGPGAARNIGLLQVTTPFVSFLDADDEVVPDFAERMLAAFDGVHYVYCDWVDGQGVKIAPPDAWLRMKENGERPGHIVTTVIPTAWALQVGGFDVTLPGGEDTDFYLRLVRAGHCGVRVASPLFTYGDGGERGERYVFSPDYDDLRRSIFERYKGITMACCGQGDRPPKNQQKDGYVLAEVAPGKAGNQRRRGMHTGNVYERSGVGDTLYVDPADIFPGSEFLRVNVEPEPTGNPDAVLAALDILGTPAARLPVFRGDERSDIAEVIKLWGAPPVAVTIQDTPAERLKMVEEEHLTAAEVTALRNGDTVNLKKDGTATVSKRAPTPRKPRVKK